MSSNTTQVGESRKAHLLALLTVLIAGSFAFRLVSSWPTRLRYPGELMDVEGMRLVEMVHLRRGVPIYAPASAERFDATLYGPLYYLLGSRLIDPERPAYFPLRLLSLLATLGCAGFAGVMAFFLSRRVFAAVLAPLIFLSYGFVTNHGLSARSDAVALLMWFGGFVVAFYFRNSRLLLLSTPLMLLGVFYKPQFVAGPMAVVLFLLLERRWRQAAEFAGALILGGLATLALFQFAIFPGQAFFLHFVVYNLIPFSGSIFLLGLLVLAFMFLVPLLVGVEFLRQHPQKLFSCYLACSAVLSLLTVAKEGSDSNYFLELIFALSVLFAASVSTAIADGMRSAELLVLLLITLFFGQWLTRPAPRPEDFKHDAALQDYLRKHFPPGTRALGHFTGDMIRAGLETPVSDVEQYAQLIRKGTLLDHDLVASLERREFGVITITFDLLSRKDEVSLERSFTERVATTIVENYQPVVSMELPGPEKFFPENRFYAWVPRSDHDSAAPDAPSPRRAGNVR